MPFNFTEKEKNSVIGKKGYDGASVGQSGIYITKSVVADSGLDAHDNAKIDVDSPNNAFRLSFEGVDGSDWVLGKAKTGGVTLGSSSDGNEFYKRLGLPRGRYELIKDTGSEMIFQYNPEL